MSKPVLEADNLTIQYQTDEGMLTAVSNASFTVNEGEYFGLVGESGCGKSTIAKAIIGGLDSNGVVESGKLRYRGTEIQDMSEKELNKEIRWSEISLIPQSSMNSLDPLQRISDQAIEIAEVHGVDEDEALKRFRDLFEVMGLQKGRISDYPHQFSGGMQQRAIIALALLLNPSIIIADEPTTALDVIMQDQIFKYLDDMKGDMDTSMVLITHDISLVFETCDQMAVMHAGQIAEEGETVEIFDTPRHPYSILLQEAFPDIRHPKRELSVIEGVPPQSFGEVNHCSFAERCPWVVEECRQQEPELRSVEEGVDHEAACFRMEEAYELYQESQDYQDSNTQEVDSDD